MKKILLITILGTLFAAGSAFAHCGACGADAAHAEKGDKMECKAECKKACCGKKAECCKAECTKSCDGEGKKCCGTEGKCCKSACTKDEAKEKAEAAAKPAPCCAGKMAPKPA
jgi:hypothetical protein